MLPTTTGNRDRSGTIKGGGPHMSKPRITLCLIARNEEQFLPGCLDSVKDVVDEIVVTDTGSTDGTPAIAARFGASLTHHPWRHDFADARNACLSRVTGDWVLVLDADERLAPGAGKALAQAIARGGFHCGRLPLYDALVPEVTPHELFSKPNLFKPPVYLHRLFRFDRLLKWENPIHERVIWLGDPNRVTRMVEAPIVHYGNVPEIRETLKKDQRNFQMLEKVVRERPRDLVMQVHFLCELFRKVKGDRARRLAERIWAELERNFSGPNPHHHPRFLNVATTHMWFLIEDRNYQAALDTGAKAGSWGFDHPNLTWLAATCLENLAYRAPDREARLEGLEKARLYYENCLAFRNRSFDSEVSPGITSYLVHLSLGRILLKLAQPVKSEAAFRLAFQDLPLQNPLPDAENLRATAILGIIESLLDQERFREAMRFIRKNRDLHHPDLEVLRAEAYERSGNFDACLDRLQKLLAWCSHPNCLTPSCELRLRELLTLVNLYKGVDQAGPGPLGVLAAVLAGAPWNDLREPAHLDASRLKRVIGFVGEHQGRDRFRRFYKPEAAVHLPVLCAKVRALLSQTPNRQTETGNP